MITLDNLYNKEGCDSSSNRLLFKILYDLLVISKTTTVVMIWQWYDTRRGRTNTPRYISCRLDHVPDNVRKTHVHETNVDSMQSRSQKSHFLKQATNKDSYPRKLQHTAALYDSPPERDVMWCELQRFGHNIHTYEQMSCCRCPLLSLNLNFQALHLNHRMSKILFLSDNGDWH